MSHAERMTTDWGVMTDKLIESILTNHKRRGVAPHVCTECHLPWPCEAVVAAQRIQAALAVCDRAGALSENLPSYAFRIRHALTGGTP